MRLAWEVDLFTVWTVRLQCCRSYSWDNYVSLQSLLSTVTRTVGAPGEEKGRRVGVVGGLCCLRGYVVHDFTAG